jgi:predicted NAD/FAD-binding protein
MRIAVVGTGISGLTVSHLLSEDHQLTVFEAGSYVGGHTHTIEVDSNGSTIPVDTGFIVFTEVNYPNFCKLLGNLDVASQPSDMSFSVSSEKTGLEYRGSSLNTLFAQRRNLFNLSFHRMLLEILRFNRESRHLLEEESSRTTLGEFLESGKHSRTFRDNYIVPMGSAIWSANPQIMDRFPARYFVQFLKNHGFLNIKEMPPWRTVRGGSHRYVDAITRSLRSQIRLNHPVRTIQRFQDHVEVRSDSGTERFDRVVIATHSDQALRLLADPSQAEREVLGKIPYQENDTVLHTDEALLPRTRRARASWNYFIPKEPGSRASLTYNMNSLQSLQTPQTYCVTLNRSEAIQEEKILRRIEYHHPVYTFETLDAQKRYDEVSGVNRTFFCGAYWGHGFHEDGVNSALAVCKHFGKSL